MRAPKFIDIDGRRYLWRDIVQLQQEDALPLDLTHDNVLSQTVNS
jgi:hypothetical protein